MDQSSGQQGSSIPPAESTEVKYLCGDCGSENVIKPRDPIRCRQCGFRIMYKMRTKRLIQFEAR
ncbi:unnamed protein product [Heterosigma akashiwo]